MSESRTRIIEFLLFQLRHIPAVRSKVADKLSLKQSGGSAITNFKYESFCIEFSFGIVLSIKPQTLQFINKLSF